MLPRCVTLILLLPAFHSARADERLELVERSDWERFFHSQKVEGTIVIVDERENADSMQIHNGERSTKGFSPASTFKIPHALFALAAGIIRDEFEIIPWDGNDRSRAIWNRDQTLRSSMRHSVVWVYERFGTELGEKREREYLEKTGYGNEAPTGKAPFWIDGDLRISAVEQIEFLQKLYRNLLPFSVEHQRLVKDVMIVEAGEDWIVRAKTGWERSDGGSAGWSVRQARSFSHAISTRHGEWTMWRSGWRFHVRFFSRWGRFQTD